MLWPTRRFGRCRLPSLALACLTVVLAGQAAAQPPEFFPAIEGAPPCPTSSAEPLTNLSVNSTLAPNCQKYWVVTAAALRGTPCDYTNSSAGSWLQVEVWDRQQVAKLNQSESLSSGDLRADPLLLLARGQQPMAKYSQQSLWQYDPSGTAVDPTGALLLSPYQQATAPSSTESASKDNLQWYITLQNVALWMNEPLQYYLRVSCQAEYACPAPLLQAGDQPAPQCSGHGTCAAPSSSFLATARLGNAAAASKNFSISANDVFDSGPNTTQPGSTSAGSSSGSSAAGNRSDSSSAVLATAAPAPVPQRVCTCQQGYGDAGCNVPVVALAQGQIASRIVPVGGWSFFELNLANGVDGLLVELNRSSGDPVLFVKPAAAGFQAGGLPTVLDYENFTDSVSFRERLNQHSRLIRGPPAGLVYIGVYNNDVYLQENAHVSLQARWSVPPGVPLCAGNCSYNGVCEANATCKCSKGFMGARCEGREAALTLSQGVGGTLGQGAWSFFTLDLTSNSAWKKNGLEVQLLASGGQPVLLAQRSGYPTLLHNDFLFRSRDGVYGEQLFRIDNSNLESAVYTLGIFNMDYFVHQAIAYQLEVDAAPGRKFSMTPYFSIIIGVTLSVLLCIVLSFLKRGLRNRRLRRSRAAMVQLGPRPRRDRGVDAALVETFPTHEFKACAAAALLPPAGVPVQVALSGLAEAALPGEQGPGNTSTECTVCLSEYVEGDVLRTLPCGHFFHAEKCIDRWLTSHSSCPICRASVVPQPPGGGPGGGDTVIQMDSSIEGSSASSSSVASSSVPSRSAPGSSSPGSRSPSSRAASAVGRVSGRQPAQVSSPPSRAEIREGAERALQLHLQQQRRADAEPPEGQPQRQHNGRHRQPGPQPASPDEGQQLADGAGPDGGASQAAGMDAPAASSSTGPAGGQGSGVSASEQRRQQHQRRQPRQSAAQAGSDRQWGAHPVQAAGRHAAATTVARSATAPPAAVARHQGPAPLDVEEGRAPPRTGWAAWASRIGGLRTGWV